MKDVVNFSKNLTVMKILSQSFHFHDIHLKHIAILYMILDYTLHYIKLMTNIIRFLDSKY